MDLTQLANLGEFIGGVAVHGLALTAVVVHHDLMRQTQAHPSLRVGLGRE